MLARLRRAWAAFWAEPEVEADIRRRITRWVDAEWLNMSAEECDIWLRVLSLLGPDAADRQFWVSHLDLDADKRTVYSDLDIHAGMHRHA